MTPIQILIVTLTVQRGISASQRSFNISGSEEYSGQFLNAGHGPTHDDGY